MRSKDKIFKPPFSLYFDYDVLGDPPSQYIADASGGFCIEVLEDPEPLVEEPGFDDDHWQIGANAWLLLELLNAHWKKEETGNDGK